jgi:hypothetical protein
MIEPGHESAEGYHDLALRSKSLNPQLNHIADIQELGRIKAQAHASGRAG